MPATPSESEQKEMVAGQVPTLVVVPANPDERSIIGVLVDFVRVVVAGESLFSVVAAVLAAAPARLEIRLELDSLWLVVILPFGPGTEVTAANLGCLLDVEDPSNE